VMLSPTTPMLAAYAHEQNPRAHDQRVA